MDIRALIVIKDCYMHTYTETRNQPDGVAWTENPQKVAAFGVLNISIGKTVKLNIQELYFADGGLLLKKNQTFVLLTT
jgi:hypothetical protein